MSNQELIAVYDACVLYPASSAVETHQQALQKLPKTPAEYLATLSQQGLPRTVAALRQICFKSDRS